MDFKVCKQSHFLMSCGSALDMIGAATSKERHLHWVIAE